MYDDGLVTLSAKNDFTKLIIQDFVDPSTEDKNMLSWVIF